MNLTTLHSASVARWQKFRPKSSKEKEKKSWLKEFVAEFWLNFTKKWQKRGRRKFSKEVPNFLLWYTRIMYAKMKLNLIFNRHCSWTRHCEIDVFGNWPNFFLNWPNFLDVLAGHFFGTWHCTQLRGVCERCKGWDIPSNDLTIKSCITQVVPRVLFTDELIVDRLDCWRSELCSYWFTQNRHCLWLVAHKTALHWYERLAGSPVTKLIG